MPVAFFKTLLSVKPKTGGEAELTVPDVLRSLDYDFVIVKAGAEEGIVRVEATETDFGKIEGDENCQKLSSEEMKQLYDSYPKPKLKQKYQKRAQAKPVDVGETAEELFETDEQGKPIVTTLQTVRSGFHLIDVPIRLEP